MFSNYSTVQLVSPIVPTVVSSLTANSLKTLAWNASVESGGTISRYSIERCQGAGCTNFTPLTTTTSTSYTDFSAAAGTIYSYRVRAQDANSFFGPYSAVATMDVPAYLDNAADGGNNGGTTSSLTYQYTVGTNANRLLVVNVAGSTSVDDISSVTYGGTPLSLIKKIQTPSGLRNQQRCDHRCQCSFPRFGSLFLVQRDAIGSANLGDQYIIVWADAYSVAAGKCK
jgi:hypothetical protein